MSTLSLHSIHADVLVIGGGGAGLRAAIEARKSGVSVLVTSRSRVGYGSNTTISGGGFAAVSASDEGNPDSGDSRTQHFRDTIEGGRFLNDQGLVKTMVDGIDQQVAVDGFDNCGRWTDEDVASFVELHIPLDHLGQLDSITYMEDLWATLQGILGEWISTVWGDNYIFIYSHDDAYDLQWTVTHEIGHNAQDATIGWETGLSQQWAGLYRSSNEYITAYAATSAAEDFAECYSAYVNDPELLQKVTPDKYDFLRDQVFDGREY